MINITYAVRQDFGHISYWNLTEDKRHGCNSFKTRLTDLKRRNKKDEKSDKTSPKIPC